MQSQIGDFRAAFCFCVTTSLQALNHLCENVFTLQVHLHTCQTHFRMSEGFCIRTCLESDAQGYSETAYYFGYNKSIEA